MPLKSLFVHAKQLGNALAGWARVKFGGGPLLDAGACAALREQARQCAAERDTESAIQSLRALIERLEAIPNADPERDRQLAETLDVLATVYGQNGQLDAALAVAERELALRRRLNQPRELVDALVHRADLLARLRRYPEAESAYADAFFAAQLFGDPLLQGIAMEKQGSLKKRQGQRPQAILLLREAVTLLDQTGAEHQAMLGWELLATTQLQVGDLDAAEASYGHSRELAERLDDANQRAVIAHNIGILYQKRAEQALEIDNRINALRQAIALVEESLRIKLDLNNPAGAEASYFQLGILHWKLSELEHAEKYLLQATALSESLNLPNVYKNYEVLARFARSLGDGEAAARWQAKCDAKVTELKQQRSVVSRGAGDSLAS